MSPEPRSSATEQRQLRLESALRLLQQELHELKNDLTAARLLADDLCAEALQRAVERIDGLSQLRRNLCEPPRRLPLDACLRTAADGWECVRLELAAPEAWIEVEQHALVLLVGELVTNARRAAGEAGEVVVRTRPLERQRVALSVDDEGPGFGPEQQSRVGLPFYSTRPEGRGAGLGLSLARSFAQSASGELICGRTESGGGRVELRLPTWPASSTPKRERVLLADTDGARRQALADRLRELGCAVQECAHMQVVSDALRAPSPPELALVEGALPGASELQLPANVRLAWIGSSPAGGAAPSAPVLEPGPQALESLLA